MEIDILKEVTKKIDDGEKVAVVTITNNNGSIPGKLGAIMAVFEDGNVLGTIGGGKVEADIIKKSLDAIKSELSFNFDCDMSEKVGLACGGSTQGFVKIFKPNKKLVIFGAGHVSRKIALLSRELEFDVYIIDDREEYIGLEEFSRIKKYIPKEISNLNNEVNFDTNTFVIITTRSHELDREAAFYLKDFDLNYVGMIGSKRKVVTVFQKLKDAGVTTEKIERIHAPIGLKIDNGTPEEIAFSILTEILMVKNKIDSI